jgi:hypothetical protein
MSPGFWVGTCCSSRANGVGVWHGMFGGCAFHAIFAESDISIWSRHPSTFLLTVLPIFIRCF